MSAPIHRVTGHADLPSLIAPGTPHIEATIEVTEPRYYIRSSPSPTAYNRSYVDLVHPRPQQLIGAAQYRNILDHDEYVDAYSRELDEYITRLRQRLWPSSRFGPNGEYVGIVWMDAGPIAAPPPNSPIPHIAAAQPHQARTPTPRLYSPSLMANSDIMAETMVSRDLFPTAGRRESLSRTSYRSEIPQLTIGDDTQDDLHPIANPNDGEIIYINPALMRPAPVASPMPSSRGSEAPGAPFPANRVASPSSFGSSYGSGSIESRDYSIPSSQNGLDVTVPLGGQCESPTFNTASFEAIKSRTKGSQEDVQAMVGSWASRVPSLSTSGMTGETISNLPTVGNSPQMSTDDFEIGQQDISQKDEEEMPSTTVKITAKVGGWVYTAIGTLKGLGFRAKASDKDPAGIV